MLCQAVSGFCRLKGEFYLNEMDQDFMLSWFRSTAQALLTERLPAELAAFGYSPISGKQFLYAPGTLPVLVVAHVDTVHPERPTLIVSDSQQQILWSPQGLGADDRSGVLAILKILRAGLRPHVLFTDGEEEGGLGAQEAAQALPAPDVRCLVEFDRQGKDDAVFYDCANPEFETYVTSFGFQVAVGSFTDISFLCPQWGIAGVNLSCGYYGAHTRAEYLVLSELQATVDKAIHLFRHLPDQKFVYIERPRSPLSSLVKGKTVLFPHLSQKSSPDPAAAVQSVSEWLGDDGLESLDRWQDVEFVVDADYLASLFGGSLLFWSDWLAQHGTELYQRLEDELFQFAAEHTDWASADPEMEDTDDSVSGMGGGMP